jgi:hypothetical protein
MRNGFLVVTLGAASVACGGSSSETPFPIEPNQAELRSGMLTRARYVPVKRSADGGGRGAEEQDDEGSEPSGEPGEGSRSAGDETIEQTPAPGSAAPDTAPSGASESDAGAPATGGTAPPTWGAPGPKR